MEDNNLKSSIGLDFSDFEIQTRSYLSICHIHAAALFSRQCYLNEKKFKGVNQPKTNYNHDAYVIGSLISATCFLEATINEFFCDIAEEVRTIGGDPLLDKLSKKTINRIRELWRLSIPKTASYSILEKYQIALTLAEKETFEKGKNPFQDIALLIELRNALVHYEPEYIQDSIIGDKVEVKVHKFEKKLKGKFELNPRAIPYHAFYPDHCLSHGCTEWAVKSSIEFVKEFYKKLGTKYKYDLSAKELKTR